MFRIESKVDTNSAQYKENYEANTAMHKTFKERLEQVKLVFGNVVLMVEQVLEPAAEYLVGEQAPAGRSRKIGDAVAAGQFHLGFSRPAGKVQQALAVHHPFPLGNGFGQVFGRQGAQDVAVIPRMLFHITQRRPVLAHGALPQHLAREKKIEPLMKRGEDLQKRMFDFLERIDATLKI